VSLGDIGAMADIVEVMRINEESSEATAIALAMNGFGRMPERVMYMCDPHIPGEDDND